MTLVYDTEELTVTGRAVNFLTVRGRTGKIVTGLLLAQDNTLILTQNGDGIFY